MLVFSLVLPACSGEEDADANGNSEATTEDEQSQPVGAVEIRPRDLSRTISVSSQVEALRTVTLASQMTGIVEEVLVEEGDVVSAGDVLARFDLTQEQAELDRAQALAEKERAAYERIKELVENEFASRAEYEEQKADLAVAESEVQLWERRLAFGTLTSPSDAVVTDRFIEPGESVSSNDETFEIANVGALVVRAGISELHVGGLSVGDEVHLRIDALPGETFEGTIRRIFPRADTDTRRVQVELQLDPDHEAIAQVRPGFLARAELTVDRRDGVFAVPEQALLASDEDESILYMITDDRLERRPVTVGASSGGWTEILDGVEEGSYAVASNPANFQEGQRVRIASIVQHPSDPDDAEEDVPTTEEVPAQPTAQE